MGKNTIFSAVIVIALAVFAGFALLHPGLPPTHDGEYHVVRFYEFNKTLRDGDWYPRWAPDLNNGYGIPLFNYVYPLPNYIASFLHSFGASFIDALKLNMFIASIAGAIFFFLWTRLFWGNLGGVISSVFYTFSPYHFLDMYIRGSVGEVWALAFFPALLWSITNFFSKKGKIFILYSGLFLAAIIFSHNILALMFLFFIILYIIFLICQSKDKRYFMLNTLCIILLGIGLSSIFWLPALLERQYVTGLQIYNISENFPQAYQLLFPSWGSGFSASDLQNQMSFQIGVANIFAVFIAIFVLIFRKRHKQHRGILVFFLAAFISIFFLMLEVSLSIWERVPFMNYFQFPWRFLSLEILIASFLAGSAVILWRSKILVCLMILLVVWLGIGYAQPAYYHNRNDEYYITRSNFIDGTNSPGNFFNTIWMDRSLGRQNKKLAGIKQGAVELSSETIRSTNYKFILTAKEDTKITINTAYYPGWQVFIDGKDSDTSYNRDGLISFNASQGPHDVEVIFADTKIRKISKTLTFIAWGIIVFLMIRYGYQSRIKR